MDAQSGPPGLAPDGTRYLEHRLEAVLRDTLTSGQLLAMTVTTEDGLPIASLEGVDSTGILSGLSAMFSDIGARAERMLGWPPVEELSLCNLEGVRLVIRLVRTSQARLLMVVLVPANRPYRRVTTQAIRRLQPLIEQLWHSTRLTQEGSP